MPARMRRIANQCFDCLAAAEYEVIDRASTVQGLYCKPHAERKLRELDSIEENMRKVQMAPRPRPPSTCHMEDLERGQMKEGE